MAQVIVNFSINEDVKSKMESACKEMGLSLSTDFIKDKPSCKGYIEEFF